MDSITASMDMNLGKLWVIVRDMEAGVLQSMGSQRVGYNLVIEQQQMGLQYKSSQKWSDTDIVNR